MIKVENLTVQYTGKKENTLVLSNINLSIPSGGTCAVIGPSGCGKSTLLKVMAGIICDYAGNISLNDKKIDPKSQVIGFMPQNYSLLPWKNVYDNVCLGLKIKKNSRGLSSEKIKLLLAQLGIDNLCERYPGELSGGQQQRVSLARVFALHPDILLMDEPFSALDAITREDMQNVFLRLWYDYAVTTILVTHYVEEALYLGQTIIILSTEPGRICRIIQNPLFGDQDIRQKEIFYRMGLELRNLIKKECWKS